jgi:4-amino-4-deoxy-L-arabinose transferase-like glycosyltransferase
MQTPGERTPPTVGKLPVQQSEIQAQPSRSSWQRSLLVIFCVAFFLRLAVITVGHTYRITPQRDHFQFGWEMGRIARSIALGQGFSSPTDLPTGPSAWTPPVYPYILACVFKLFGVYSVASAWVILAFNSLFGALTCITLYYIATRIFGAKVAIATAWTWALFPYAIYWPVRVVWEASMSAFLLSLALLLTLRLEDEGTRVYDWIVYGALWGFIALTNTALLSILPCFLVWLLYCETNRTQLLMKMCLALVVTAAIITPWLIRNYTTFGKFIFIRDNLPLEMYVANNDHSNGLWTRSEHPGNDPEAMQHFQDLGELRFMEEKHQQFRAFVATHTGQFLGFTAKRALYFWIGTPQNVRVGTYNLLAARHITFFLGSALAFAGLWFVVRKRKLGTFLFACFLFLYPLPYYLVNPFPRYKHPIEPIMVLLIVYLVCELRNRRSPLVSQHELQ